MPHSLFQCQLQEPVQVSVSWAVLHETQFKMFLLSLHCYIFVEHITASAWLLNLSPVTVFRETISQYRENTCEMYCCQTWKLL